MRYVVIMAGGSGTRLWPLSKKGMPKQLLNLVAGKSLLRLAFERACALVPPERIWVVTGAVYADVVAQLIPELPESQILGEPMGRDSLNAAAWPAAVLLRRDPDAVIAQLTADHLIEPVDVFAAALEQAFQLAETGISDLDASATAASESVVLAADESVALAVSETALAVGEAALAVSEPTLTASESALAASELALATDESAAMAVGESALAASEAVLAAREPELVAGEPTLAVSESALTIAGSPVLVTLGVVPTEPHTGYGYIHSGARLPNQNAFAAAEFTEKPELALAKQYVASGEYWWNSGMFIWRADVFLAQVKQLVPDCFQQVTKLAEHPEQLAEIFGTLPKISIDYAVMEPVSRGRGSARVVTVPLNVSWRDIGGYASLATVFDSDDSGNAVSGQAVCLDSAANVVINTDTTGIVALVGVKDLVVVRTPDATLVVPIAQAERVKAIVSQLYQTNPRFA